MKDVKVEIRFKNNLILSRIKEKWDSISAFCQEWGFTATAVGKFINFRRSPLTTHKRYAVYGEDGILWLKSAVEIARALGCLPEDIFPEQLREVRKNRYEVEVSLTGIEHVPLMLIDSETPEDRCLSTEMKRKLLEIINTLPFREKRIILDRFGIGCPEHTLEEVAQKFGVTRERIRQFEHKALRHLRHPKYSKKVKQYW